MICFDFADTNPLVFFALGAMVMLAVNIAVVMRRRLGLTDLQHAENEIKRLFKKDSDAVMSKLVAVRMSPAILNAPDAFRSTGQSPFDPVKK